MAKAKKEKALSDKAFSTKSKALYLAIGEMVVRWGALEHSINSAIWALASTSDRDGACLTAQMPSVISRMRALIALVRENHGTDRLVKALNKFASKMDELSRSRNRIIHDRWLVNKYDGRIGRFAVTADRKLVFGIEVHDVAAIQTLSTEIEKAQAEFSQLRVEIGNDLAVYLKEKLGAETGDAIQQAVDRLSRGSPLVEQ